MAKRSTKVLKEETSSEVSSLAAKMVAYTGAQLHARIIAGGVEVADIIAAEVRTLAASCLTQDETKGK